MPEHMEKEHGEHPPLHDAPAELRLVVEPGGAGEGGVGGGGVGQALVPLNLRGGLGERAGWEGEGKEEGGDARAAS